METKYYDGTKLLSLQDINGKPPELYLCTTNRSGGKTTFFSRYLVNRYLKNGDKFALIYRYNYEIDDISNKFFKDINSLFFDGYIMTSERRARGIFHELFITRPYTDEPEPCGYAISINSTDQLKKYSHLFSDIQLCMMDEFQSESNKYCPNEIQKFISLHTTIARGQGKQYRKVPVYMLSNAVSLINPYYVALGISARLQNQTKFLKGDGFVLEQGFIESASRAQEDSAFARAFKEDKYVQYASQNIYLNDSSAFIEKPQGISRYLGTIKYLNKEYGLKEFMEDGVVYCDNRPDKTYPFKLAVTTDDHNINYVMLRNNDMFIQNMRFYFEKGCFRFRDLSCKEAVMTMVTY